MCVCVCVCVRVRVFVCACLRVCVCMCVLEIAAILSARNTSTVHTQLYLQVTKLVAKTYIDVAIHMYKLCYDNYHTTIWLRSQILIFNLYIVKSY